jgi:ammonium transporter, Amt family
MSTEALAMPSLMPASVVGSSANMAAVPYLETGFASTAFLIICSALVMLMTPGVGLLYSGLSTSKNALTIIFLAMLSYAVVSVQWVLFGFSLAFSETGTSMLGNFDFAGFTSVGSQGLPLTAPQVPAIVFALYQLQFATVTVAIIFGAGSDRMRILPAILFMFVWTTLIYDPVAYWTW